MSGFATLLLQFAGCIVTVRHQSRMLPTHCSYTHLPLLLLLRHALLLLLLALLLL
jgi:hypothetical protein